VDTPRPSPRTNRTRRVSFHLSDWLLRWEEFVFHERNARMLASRPRAGSAVSATDALEMWAGHSPPRAGPARPAGAAAPAELALAARAKAFHRWAGNVRTCRSLLTKARQMPPPPLWAPKPGP